MSNSIFSNSPDFVAQTSPKPTEGIVHSADLDGIFNKLTAGILVNRTANKVKYGDRLDMTAYAVSVECGNPERVEGLYSALTANGYVELAVVTKTKFRKNDKTRITVEINGEPFNITYADEEVMTVFNDTNA